MPLIVQDVALQMIRTLKPLVDQVQRHDRALADQMRRAASSVVLNIAEGARSHGKNEVARFHCAAGSANETRAALKLAVAWQYFDEAQSQAADDQLDRVLALLWGLTRRPRRGR